MSVNAGTAVAYLELNTKNFSSGIKSAKAALSDFTDSSAKFSQKMKSVGSAMTATGATLTKTVTLPLTALGTIATKSAITFESAFAGVKKTVNATSDEYKTLSKNIKQMATETASSSTEIAGVMEVAGQLGIEVGESGKTITKFTRTMIELGDATNLTAEEAATSLAQFSNIMGTATEDVQRLGSSIVALGNNFATDERRIVEMSTRLASAGRIARLTETEILALSTAMSSVGIEAEAGGTAMSQTLAAIETAVVNGGDSLQQFASIAGMSSQAFADAWKNTPLQALQQFIAGLGGLESQGESATLVLEEMGLSGIRQSNMLKALALSSDNLTAAVDLSNKAWEENTALSDEAAQRYATTESKLKQLKEGFNNVAIEIGEILIPYLEKLVNWLQGLIDKWNALEEWQKNVIVTFGLIVAAVGPLLLALGNLIKLLAEIKMLGGIAGIFGGGVGGVGMLSTLFGNIAKGVGNLGLQLGALKASGAGAGKILVGAGTAAKGLGAAVGTTALSFATFDTFIKNTWIKTIGNVTGDMETMDKMMIRYGQAGSTWRIVADNVDVFGKKIKGLPAVLDGAQYASKALGEALDNIANGTTYTNEQLSVMQQKWQLTSDDMEMLRQAMIDVNPEITKITDKFTILNNASFETLQQVSQGLDAMSSSGKTVDQVLNGSVKIVGGLNQESMAFFNRIKKDSVEVITTVGAVEQKILDQSGKLNEVGKNIVRGLNAGMESEKQKTSKVVSDLMGNIKAPLESQTTTAVKAGVAVIQGFNNGITKSAETTKTAVSKWMLQVPTTMHTALDEHSPSRLSEKSAMNVVTGFNKGIENNANTTNKSVNGWLFDIINIINNNTNYNQVQQSGYNIMSALLIGMQRGFANVTTWLSNSMRSLSSNVQQVRYAGSYANGLDYVPYNGFIAQLHQGERVLTKEESQSYNKGDTGGDTFIFNSPKEIDEYEAARLLRKTKKELNL